MELDTKERKPIFIDGITVVNGKFDFSLYGLKVKRMIKNDGSIESEQNEVVCEITMSPQLAKALKEILEDNLNQYEKVYGKLPDK